MTPACDLPPDHAQHLQNLLNSTQKSLRDQNELLQESDRRTKGLEEELRVAIESAEQHRQVDQCLSEIESLIRQLATDQQDKVRDIVRHELREEASAGGSGPEFATLKEKLSAVDSTIRNMTEEIRTGFQNAANANASADQHLKESVTRLGVKIDGAYDNVTLQLRTCFKQCMLSMRETRSELLNRLNDTQASVSTTTRDAAVGNEGSENEANTSLATGGSCGSPPAASGDGDEGARTESNPPESDSDESLFEPMPKTDKRTTSSSRYQLREAKRRCATQEKAKRQGVTSKSSSMPSSKQARKTSPERTTSEPAANSGHPRRKRRSEVEMLKSSTKTLRHLIRTNKKHY